MTKIRKNHQKAAWIYFLSASKGKAILGVTMAKLVCKVQVKNSMGLHTRPATTIVKLLQNSKSEVMFTHKQDTINAKSILSILMLAAKKNSKITIAVDGEDAELTMQQLKEAFANEFGE